MTSVPALGRLADLLLGSGALRFGDLVTRSGRPTPYFVDLGRVRTGTALATLGDLYADAVLDTVGDAVDVLFGPAYKGIPIAVATAVALGRRGHDVTVVFDRKEAKDHGEGGRLVGGPPPPGSRVVIVEDVTTAGTSVRASVPLLAREADVEVVGLVVAVDRLERGERSDRTALEGLAADLGIATRAIATIDDLVAVARDRRDASGRPVLTSADLERIAAYRAEYGVTRT